jgi:hypothetical protein
VKPAQLDAALRAVEDARIAAKLAAETIAAQQAHSRSVEGKLAVLIREADGVLETLEDRADVVDGPEGTQRPDWVARLANTLRDALTAARR